MKNINSELVKITGTPFCASDGTGGNDTQASRRPAKAAAIESNYFLKTDKSGYGVDGVNAGKGYGGKRSQASAAANQSSGTH